jgi:hypothetical protein
MEGGSTMSTKEPTEPDERGGSEPVSTAEQILSTPPASRAIEGALAERPRRRGMSGSTGVLALIVLVAVGFLGGLLLGRHTASGQAAAPGGFPGGFPTSTGAPGAGGTADGFTAGTVTRVDGDTLYVKTTGGETVEVVVSADTEIRISEAGTVSDLQEGSTVAVQGSENDQGVIEAQRVSEGDLGFVGRPGGAMPSAVASGSAGTG